jgi:hypothetical protein
MGRDQLQAQLTWVKGLAPTRYLMTLQDVIFDKTFRDSAELSHKSFTCRQKFTSVNRLQENDYLCRNLVPFYDTKVEGIPNSSQAHKFLTTQIFVSYYVTLYDATEPRHEEICHKIPYFF